MKNIHVASPPVFLDSFGSSSPKEAAEKVAILGQLGGKWNVLDNQAFVLDLPEHLISGYPFRIITIWRYQHASHTEGLVIIKAVPVAYGAEGLTIVPQIGERG